MVRMSEDGNESVVGKNMSNSGRELHLLTLDRTRISEFIKMLDSLGRR